MSYIPHGADRQGRRITGVWTTEDVGRSVWRRSGQPVIQYEDIPSTIPTKPAPFDAAHGCWEPEDDRPIEGGGVIVWLAGAIGAVLACALLAHIGARLGLLS